jgi:hypothetical protein
MAAAAAALLGGAGSGLFGVCGPFTDVSDPTFCPFVLEIFTLGITTGTTPTTYDPAGTVSRLQMAAFLSRTVDRTLQRSSRRAILNQFWTPQNGNSLGLTTVGNAPLLVQSDGTDLWVTSSSTGTVSRVSGSSAKLLETWTGATGATGVLVAAGRIFVTGGTSPGNLYQIDPAQSPAGAVTTVATNLGGSPNGITFDGARIWTANQAGSLSIVTPGTTIPWTVTTVSAGFTQPWSALFDGSFVWMTDPAAHVIRKFNSSAAVLQTVTLGVNPAYPAFDGTNIWVPNSGDISVSVVRASSGAILATLTGNGLIAPASAVFDGERVLVTNQWTDTVSLFKAADLTPLGSFSTGPSTYPYGACADGAHIWITLNTASQLARF